MLVCLLLSSISISSRSASGIPVHIQGGGIVHAILIAYEYNCCVLVCVAYLITYVNGGWVGIALGYSCCINMLL